MIGPHPTSLWGRGKGVLRQTAPEILLLSWLLLISACIVARPTRLMELVLVLTALSLWISATGTGWRTIRRFLLLALVFFLPFFLFIPWTGSSDTVVKLVPLIRIRSDAWITPFTILFRGSCCLLLGAGLISVLSESDFYRVVTRLPAPRIFPVMIHQIMRFLAPLTYEGICISRAVMLRGGTTGWKAGVKVARALPSAWLPRVLARSTRVSMAMEVRGYSGQLMAASPFHWRLREVLALLIAASFLAAEIVLRGIT